MTQAIEWLYRRDPSAPFLLYLSFAGPRASYTPPAWAFDRYLHDDANGTYQPLRSDWEDVWEPWKTDHEPDAHDAAYDDLTARRARAGYFGNMTHINAQLGRFLTALREFGDAYDTYIAFTSDHGEMLGDHGMWRKGYPYEGSAGVPLLVAGPGIDGGSTCSDLVTLEDLMPTLLELAGLSVPDGIDGRSNARRLLDGPGPEAPHLALHGEHVIFGLSLQWIVTPRWKYVWRSDDGTEQLFDFTRDGERRDLARSPDGEHVQVLAALRSALVQRLRDRPEGFVFDGQLVAGRPVSPLLDLPVAAEPVRVPGAGTAML
ncbi:sulfatase-like hydrolase/transferase [Isoptericola sp. NPDC056618]|uniref:sulfatase-like hydrolase/transferase n=1 Tax=Isoptericola sp. NPDC056618 TaxID=3345878 RepID=UPI003679E740